MLLWTGFEGIVLGHLRADLDEGEACDLSLWEPR